MGIVIGWGTDLGAFGQENGVDFTVVVGEVMYGVEVFVVVCTGVLGGRTRRSTVGTEASSSGCRRWGEWGGVSMIPTVNV